MTDIQLYAKLAELPSSLKAEVSDFIDYLKFRSKKKDKQNSKRIAGKAKGLIAMKDNFDDPIEGFDPYLK
ncbi:DUF2281 domain-containing protein [Cryomorpha ignava]|uniref:DUF2281 domain-containing protein n=1 Tax=Cryomorpha ignava TaxID=101383 RepID=A0A7K3WSQ6_9FLAO|nr:DUF2281 domain-containing protein [Cryomorpha ignava]NEN24514.1 DUF2281 domain-containing protein [Cryomorpha ignava]